MTRTMLLAGLLLASTARAATPDLMAPINQFINGTPDEAQAACLSDANIIDEVPPYLWSGRGACQRWWADLMAHDKAAGITDQKVTIGTPSRKEVVGDMAYVIVPAVFTFTQKGVAMREPATITYALKQQRSGWKIAGWTWTGRAAKPVAAKK